MSDKFKTNSTNPNILRPKTSNIFQLNTKQLDEFVLPKKRVSNSTIFMNETNNHATSKKDKISKSLERSKDTSDEIKKNEVKDEFSFLSTMMMRPKTNQNTLFSSTVPIMSSKSSEDKLVNEIGEDVDPNIPQSDSQKQVGVVFDKKAWSDEDDVNVILSSIHTSDDAINFFARYGSETPLKFIHLILDNSTDNNSLTNYNPYQLKVINYVPDSNSEYYIMSSIGITFISYGSPSECIPLSAFMRQGMIFKILRNIPYFKYYLHRKIFNNWKENVRYNLYLKQRDKLKNRSFLLRNNTCKLIFLTKHNLLELQNYKLLNMDLKTLSIEDFYNKQIKIIDEAGLKFESTISTIYKNVELLINEINANYMSYKNEMNNTNNYNDINTDKNKSLIKIKQEKEEKKMQKYIAKLEYNTVTDFVRFIDYLVVECLSYLAINTCTYFHEELIKTRKAGIILTTILFEKNIINNDPNNFRINTVFVPDTSNVCTKFGDILSKIIESVKNVNRIIYLVNKTNYNSPSVENIIKENKQYSVTSNKIQQLIHFVFNKANESAEMYQILCTIYTENLLWNVEKFRSEEHDISELKSLIEKFNGYQKELEKFRNRQTYILELECNNLKSILSPMLEQRLQEIKDYIKEIAK